ncbi:MAG: hypothetical protein AB1Z23_07625 [Eubacteriales bacterium]
MKRDINLIPRKNAGPKQSKGLTVIILVAVFYVIILVLAIMIPKGIKEGFIIIENQLTSQIEQMQPQVDEYEALKLEFQLLQQEKESAGEMNFSKFNAIDAMQILQSTCPEGVRILSIDNSDIVLIVDVIAQDNYQVAQYALELERTGNFTQINISGSSPTTVILNEEERALGESGVLSSIYLVYDLSEPEEMVDETSADGTTQEGGN